MFNLTDDQIREFLKGRLIATIGTENADGSIHLTAVWYLHDDDFFYVATSSRSRKARNVSARGKASLMVDLRKPGAERGVTASGTAELITGRRAEALNRRVHLRYMSEAALADPSIGPVFNALDDVTIRLTPTSWVSWDTAAVDAQLFHGALARTAGCFLPLA